MSINVLNSNGKVTGEHLKKTAYLYIRQSTLRQVWSLKRIKSAYSTTGKHALSSGKAARRGKVRPCSRALSFAASAAGG
jgi:hypothetical protein